MTIIYTCSSFDSFQFLQVLFLISESCSPTTRGGHSQLISFLLGELELCLQKETKKKIQHGCNEKEEIPLHLMAGKTLMSFLKAELSKGC